MGLKLTFITSSHLKAGIPVSNVYVTSDWHIGHSRIHEKFRTQFVSESDHDSYILKRARDTVSKRDILIVLGDVTWTSEGLQKIKDADFPCKMIMIAGNHDDLPMADYLTVFDEVRGAWKYKKYWMTHIPIHPQELYRGKNIHGHCHAGGPDGESYFNAILEFNDYAPVSMMEVGNTLASRPTEAVT